MKSLKALTAVCILALTTLTGCQRKEVTTETFVNKADATQVLKLESQPSLKIDLIGRFHNVESAGVYTLKTEKGTISGTYTYVVDSKSKLRQYIFHPQEGDRWTAKLDSHGSFTDEKGDLWRIQQFKVDAKERVPLQVFK
jgi:hypothetical protein